MGEVDHADDAVHHGVTDGDQAVDHAERDAIDQLLQGVGQTRSDSVAMRNATMRAAYGARCLPSGFRGSARPFRPPVAGARPRDEATAIKCRSTEECCKLVMLIAQRRVAEMAHTGKQAEMTRLLWMIAILGLLTPHLGQAASPGDEAVDHPVAPQPPGPDTSINKQILQTLTDIRDSQLSVLQAQVEILSILRAQGKTPNAAPASTAKAGSPHRTAAREHKPKPNPTLSAAR